MPPSFPKPRLLPIDADIGIRAMLQKRLGQIQAAEVPFRLRSPLGGIAHGRRAIRARLPHPRESQQGRPARVSRIRVRAAIQQNAAHFEIRVDDGHAQRAGRIRRGVVHVGSVIQQYLGGVNMIVADREQQGREAGRGFRLHIRAELDQHRLGRGVAFGRRPHQRGLSFVSFLHVRIRAGRKQNLHRIGLAGERRGHQRGLSFFRSAVRIGAGFD